MRILFLPLITRGHAIGTISRFLAIASELKAAGAEVAFLTNGEGGVHVAEAGYEHWEGALPEPPARHHPLYDLSDVAVFLNLTREDYIRKALDAELRAVERFRPDALVSEFKLTAPITAQKAGLPLVSTACAPAHPDFVSPLAPPGWNRDHAEAVAGFNRVLKSMGQEPIRDVSELFFTRSAAKIAPTSPELEPLLANVPDLEYVGWLLYDAMEFGPMPPGLLDGVGGKKLVYAYFSAGEIGARQYVEVLPKVFDGGDRHVIVACGNDPLLPVLPANTPNVTWARFVPARRILAKASALLFHGGQNTAMASLLHGAPSLIFPGNEFERDFNARGLERVGAGKRLPLEFFTPGPLAEQLADIVDNPQFAQDAARHGERLKTLGGPRKAAMIALRAAGVGQRAAI